ncbi:hypothetical protein [Phyllobacterium endophyticum]|uniref:Uncharacterized protein n=1 Tax=Phyllobacterium endophyticum TaxID=1149773 RepID=A0A2P7AKH7_9HYPH|nr:hypothetical protein [Phyllobacterium endophyticum]MBB3237049.1 fumarylacetoacetate (FAA) hydrolase family protein [Phyllobacterium endophyticum]PSH54702.1 hypothetical protein CU100_26415 [Phyllobacterium endophyticum]TYR40531.1 hypothetical protein FY050_16545 [Phyllobacterium endophyticum]
MWRADLNAPSGVILRNGIMLDVTAAVKSVADFLDDNPAARFETLTSEPIGKPEHLVLAPAEIGYGPDAGHGQARPAIGQVPNGCVPGLLDGPINPDLSVEDDLSF